MPYCQKTGIESVYLEDSKNSLYFAVKKKFRKICNQMPSVFPDQQHVLFLKTVNIMHLNKAIIDTGKN